MRPGTLIAMACAALVSVRAHAQSPLDRAHAHNDYEHTRPLLDALDRGFGSVEADIYLVNGALLVAHERDSVRADRTLEALYLAPLRAWTAAHGGRVYGDRPPLTLLIDVKSQADSTWAALVGASPRPPPPQGVEAGAGLGGGGAGPAPAAVRRRDPLVARRLDDDA